MAKTQTQLTESFAISNNGPNINREEQIITQFLYFYPFQPIFYHKSRLNPEKHHEILNKVSLEDKKKLHKALKAIPLRSRHAYQNCSKICSLLTFSLFFCTNVYFIYFSFFHEWTPVTIGFLIFTCLLFSDFTNIFKTLVPCCNQKIAEMVKFFVNVSGFVIFVLASLKIDRETKKYEIAVGVCGTMLGYFLATVFGKELKKFSKKTFQFFFFFILNSFFF